MFEHCGSLACRCEGGFPYRVSAPQNGPDLRCQPNFLQAPRQALPNPVRTLQGHAARDRNQDDPVAEG